MIHVLNNRMKEQVSFVGSLVLKATKADYARFVLDTCNAKISTDGCMLTLKNKGWNSLKDSNHISLYFEKEYDFRGLTEDGLIGVILAYRQKEDIYVEDLKHFSKSYNMDFRLFAGIPGMTLFRNAEIITGRITYNELLKLEEGEDLRNWWMPKILPEPVKINLQDSSSWWPQTEFGDDPMCKERAFGDLNEVSEQILPTYSALLKKVAALQGKFFIDKCPCCGHDEMLTYKAITDGRPSKDAGVYICLNCGLKESEGTIPPLSKWAVFKKENVPVFFPEENYNCKDLLKKRGK